MLTRAEVEARLHTAILTLDAVADPDRRFVRQKTTRWVAILRDFEEDFGWSEVRHTRYVPTRSDLDTFLDTLDWIRAASAREHYSLIRQRAYKSSWRTIAGRRGRSDQYWRRLYDKVLDAITYAANGLKVRDVSHTHDFA